MSDYIKMIIDGIRDTTAYLLGKEIEKEYLVYNGVESSGELYALLMQMTAEGNICKAENLLFKELDDEFTVEKYLAGLDFYEYLNELGEAYLKGHNFSLLEVEQGLKDLEKYNVNRV